MNYVMRKNLIPNLNIQSATGDMVDFASGDLPTSIKTSCRGNRLVTLRS